MRLFILTLLVYSALAERQTVKKPWRPVKAEKYKEKMSELKRALRKHEAEPKRSQTMARSFKAGMQMDVFDDYEETIAEVSDQDEVMGNLLRNVIGESRTVRRRLNRAIQDNEGLRKRIEKLEFLLGGEAPTEENQLVQGITRRIDLLEKEEIEGKVMFNRLREVADETADLVNNAISRTNEVEDEIKSCKKDIKSLKSETSILNQEGGSLSQDLTQFKKFVANIEAEREKIIADFAEDFQSVGLGMERGLAYNGQSMSSENLANMAKAMWQLPANCDELADKGLTAAENGPYLIHPNKSVDPFLVQCDFSSGETILPVKKSRNDFPECEGSECSVIDLAYEVGQLQIEALKTEMKYCNQALDFTCSSTSISDRVTWMGSNNEWNKYYSGKGEVNGCACSIDGENNCYGGFLCNCDAQDGSDNGLLENKDSLPVLR